MDWSKIIENAMRPTENLNLFVGENADIWVVSSAILGKTKGTCELKFVFEADFWNDIEGFLIDNSYAKVIRCGTLESLPVKPYKTAVAFMPKVGDVVIDVDECIIYCVTSSIWKS